MKIEIRARGERPLAGRETGNVRYLAGCRPSRMRAL